MEATQEVVVTSTGYLPMLLLMAFTAFISVTVYLLATYLGPNRPNKAKNAPYECGIVPSEPVHQRLDVHFYRVGILFLIFGVELLFFFPWALAMANSPDKLTRIIAFLDMTVFALILVAGLVFAWSKGGLKWSTRYRTLSEFQNRVRQ